jgi:hypothetical protein
MPWAVPPRLRAATGQGRCRSTQPTQAIHAEHTRTRLDASVSLFACSHKRKVSLHTARMPFRPGLFQTRARAGRPGNLLDEGEHPVPVIRPRRPARPAVLLANDTLGTPEKRQPNCQTAALQNASRGTRALRTCASLWSAPVRLALFRAATNGSPSGAFVRAAFPPPMR